MSVYLDGSSVLLDGSSVATDEACCCGGGCCDVLEPFTTITASGNVIGCDTGGGSMGMVTYGRVAAPPLCNLSLHEWSKDVNCGCQFKARCCAPFVTVGEVHTDNTNDDCSDPDYGHCGFVAVIDCNTGKVQFLCSTTGAPLGSVCCNKNANLTSALYDIPAGPGSIEDTVVSDTNPTISFHFKLDFA